MINITDYFGVSENNLIKNVFKSSLVSSLIATIIIMIIVVLVLKVKGNTNNFVWTILGILTTLVLTTSLHSNSVLVTDISYKKELSEDNEIKDMLNPNIIDKANDISLSGLEDEIIIPEDMS